jgi:hypothetical protein
VAPSEKALLKRVRRFVPVGVQIVAVESANANPIDTEHRATPVVLTDRGLMLISSSGLTGIVTDVPYIRVTEARADGSVLTVSFLDDTQRPRAFEADFGRGGARIIEPFLRELNVVQPQLSNVDDRTPLASYHVAWNHGRGATLDVFENDRRKVVIKPRYDDEVAGLEAAEACKQAIMELTRAIADKPELVWVRTKADWMPDFVWNPPLP